ncbi:hypothetical protein [Novosphingobium sp. B 225]|uniref:hypothetical protein n=1 Tax=Novosphingobium sp. B 225 TaxID=1961849 RepID=UPI001124F05A|nr:hypothetical protein [Novosphingobium sp. B 225]
MKHLVTIAAALGMAAMPGTGAAQTVKAISGAAVAKVTPDRIAAAARRAQRPTALAKATLAATAQKVLGLTSQPSIGEPVVLNASQMYVNGTTLWFEQVTYSAIDATPVVALGQEGAKSRINIMYSASSKPLMVDCDFQLSAANGLPFNASFMVYQVGASSAPVYSGSGQIGADGHLVLAVPGSQTSPKLQLQISMPSFPGWSDFMMLNACRVYQLG